MDAGLCNIRVLLAMAAEQSRANPDPANTDFLLLAGFTLQAERSFRN